MSKNFNKTIDNYTLLFNITCNNKELLEVEVTIPPKRPKDRGRSWDHNNLRNIILEKIGDKTLIKSDDNNHLVYAKPFVSTSIVFCFKKPLTVTTLKNDNVIAKSKRKITKK
jgi:hypothetical protein